MQGSTQAVVTPGGVRDGDPAALAGLVDRRGSAVLAFCDAVCAPDVAPRAAAEAFARFRAAVATAEDPAALNPEVLLLGATRHAAASMARTATGGGGFRRVLGGARQPQETCALVPTLLAARAEDMLSPADQDRLTRHLERCPGCREIEAAFRRAERAYRSPPDRPIPPQAREIIMAALSVAVPLAHAAEWEDEPAEPATEAAAIDGRLEVVEEAAVADAPLNEPEPVAEEEPPSVDEPAATEPLATGSDAAEAVEADEGPFDEADRDADEEPVDDDEPLDEEPLGLDESPLTTDEPLGAEESPLAADEPLEADPDHVESDPDHVEPDPELTAMHPAVPEDVTAVHEAVAVGAATDEAAAATPTALPRPRRHFHLSRHEHDDHGPLYRYVLPGAAVAIAIIVIMAVAGVFGGDDATPTRTQPARGTGSTATPLPVSTVAAREPVASRTTRRRRTVKPTADHADRRAAATTTTSSTPAAAAPTPAASTPAAPAATGGTKARSGTELTSRTGGTVDKAGTTESSSLPASSGDSSQSEPVYSAGGAGPP